MIHHVYRLVTIAGGPLIGWYLRRRMARGKEDPIRFAERLGHPGKPRPAGPLVWLHAASVGEAQSLLPLIELLDAKAPLTVLVTTGTVTSARLLAERLPPTAIHQFVPVDRPAAVTGFLDHWRPDLALWAESDFWPNLLAETRRRGIDLVLVQGRISPRSFASWRRVPRFIRRVLANFTLCLAQTDEDARRLTRLGAHEVRCLGNLKLAVPPLPCDPARLERGMTILEGRPRWLASSTHPGEEAIAGRVHQALATSHPGLLTMVAPRHPNRGPAVAEELTALGLNVALRSRGDIPDAATDIYVADTMGELGLFYRLAPIVFVGKSLAAEGGQNPFEPARLGAAVLFGPRMSNFPDMAPPMVAAKAAIQVADEAELTGALDRLLADPAMTTRLGAAALSWAESEAGALEKVAAALGPFLAAAEARHARP